MMEAAIPHASFYDTRLECGISSGTSVLPKIKARVRRYGQACWRLKDVLCFFVTQMALVQSKPNKNFGARLSAVRTWQLGLGLYRIAVAT
jgi:hypothetical protein